MPEGAYGLPVQPASGKPVSVLQAVAYWPGANSASDTFTVAAPTKTMLALLASDKSSTPGPCFAYTHTGYRWRPIAQYQVDRASYPVAEIWIGQPAQRGIAGGTSITFSHNGTAAFPGGYVLELSRYLLGEIVSTWGGWGNGAGTSTISSTYDSMTWTAPKERNLFLAYIAAGSSGGAGLNAGTIPAGFSQYTGGALSTAVVGSPQPGALLLPANWCSLSRNATMAANGVILR